MRACSRSVRESPVVFFGMLAQNPPIRRPSVSTGRHTVVSPSRFLMPVNVLPWSVPPNQAALAMLGCVCQ